MIIDLKYHITSLAAVFLALAIGVVTGTVMLGNDTIVWQQEKMTDSLESEISNLRDNNLQLRKKTEELDRQMLLSTRFEQSVLPQLIADKLTGMRVVVIDTCSRGLGGDISQLLTQSGAQVQAVVELLPAYGGTSGIPAALATTDGGKRADLRWEEVSRRVAGDILTNAGRLASFGGSADPGESAGPGESASHDGSTGSNGSAKPGESDNPSRSASPSASASPNVPGSQVLTVLQQNQLVKVFWAQARPFTVDAPKTSAEEKVDAVIILGGSKRKELPRRQFEYTDLPMIKYFKEQGVRVVGVEPIQTSVSYIPYFKKYNLSTVDNVDTIAGKLSLVLAVEGSQGNFGIKGTAQKYLPLDQ